MSRLFAPQFTAPYIGSVFARPIADNPNVIVSPQCVPVSIDWNVYWQVAGNSPSTISIQMNLTGANAQVGVIDRIRSVKIDNTGSSVPIYIQFLDTLDVIVCPPNTVVTERCNTQSLNPIIYAVGLSAGFLPKTMIQFMNVWLPPNVDPEIQTVFPQWAGSPAIQRSNLLTPGYSSPALGDQVDSNNVSTGIAGSVNVLQTPRASGVFVLTAASIKLASGAAASSPAQNNIFLESTGLSGILYNMVVPSLGATFSLQDAYSQSGLQLRLNATEVWRLRFPALTAGILQYYLTYTYIP